MKLFASILILSFSLQASAYVFEQTGCTAEQVKAAEQALKDVLAEHPKGKGFRSDILLAQMHNAETIFCSEAPNPYMMTCQNLLALQKRVEEDIELDVAAGFRKQQAYDEQRTKLVALHRFCK